MTELAILPALPTVRYKTLLYESILIYPLYNLRVIPSNL
jgi:hypothetical protein